MSTNAERFLHAKIACGFGWLPFVLLFATSVFFLVHAWLPKIVPETSNTRVVPALPLPGDLQTLSGRPLIDALKRTLEKADVHGEVGFVRHLIKEEKLIVPVTIPGRETIVWWELPQKRLLGAVMLGLGSLSCGLFCIGSRWLF